MKIVFKKVAYIWSKYRFYKSYATRKKISKEAYARYIGNIHNLTPENVAEANAFCMGARFQRTLK